MTWRGKSVLGIVPARGGSKGIPRKNLAKVAGLSLVGHAARLATQLSWLDGAVLSTDDPEVASEGRLRGLQVPFMRPAELASDEASAVEMWAHAWQASEAHYGRRFDCAVLLQPTSPLREHEDVERTIEAMLAGGHKAAATVSRVPGHYTPEKLLVLQNGVLQFLHPDGQRHVNRQTIPAYYTRNGLCYAAVRSQVVEHRRIIEADCAAVLIDRFVPNIDDPVDLEIARYFADRRQHSGGDLPG